MPDGMNYLPKPDVLSVRSLRDWLRQQDGETAYCYDDNGLCLLAKYFTDCGYVNVNMGASLWTHGRTGERVTDDLPRELDAIAGKTPRTYAAALSRCNDYLSNTEGRDGEA